LADVAVGPEISPSPVAEAVVSKATVEVDRPVGGPEVEGLVAIEGEIARSVVRI
jgi:hypothetical protein